MRKHSPPDCEFDVALEKAKVAFRKDRQRKNERAPAQRQATQREAANERGNIRS